MMIQEFYDNDDKPKSHLVATKQYIETGPYHRNATKYPKHLANTGALWRLGHLNGSAKQTRICWNRLWEAEWPRHLSFEL